jgi:hypothetical protein
VRSKLGKYPKPGDVAQMGPHPATCLQLVFLPGSDDALAFAQARIMMQPAVPCQVQKPAPAGPPGCPRVPRVGATQRRRRPWLQGRRMDPDPDPGSEARAAKPSHPPHMPSVAIGPGVPATGRALPVAGAFEQSTWEAGCLSHHLRVVPNWVPHPSPSPNIRKRQIPLRIPQARRLPVHRVMCHFGLTGCLT